jgi:hypothetical protein
MTVVKLYNTRKLRAALLVLVLSALACSVPVPASSTTAVTTPTVSTETPAITVVEDPDNTPVWRTTVVRPVVNVREKPGGKVIATLGTGDTVEIVNCTGSWCQIQKPAGFVFRGCLSDNPARLGCQAK